MNEKTMGAIPVSALERLEQSAVKLSLITFCLRHEELKAAPDAAEIHSIKSDLSRALREVSTNAAACALTGGATEKASPPAGAEPKRIQRKEIPKGTAYGVLRLRCPKCGDVFGRFLREPSASVTCRCGGEIQLDNLTRYEFTCPCCDFEARGRTNLEDPEITVPCKCGNPVTMKWDRNKRMYHISIHALREEGDDTGHSRFLRCQNFYPRPPRGGRQQKQRQNLYFQTNYTTFCTNLEEP